MFLHTAQRPFSIRGFDLLLVSFFTDLLSSFSASLLLPPLEHLGFKGWHSG